MDNEPKKTKKQPNEQAWKKWADELFLPWYDRNKPIDLEIPKNQWKQWGEEIYTPWYEKNKPGGVVASSNPNDPPPPPPGPIRP